MAMQPVHRRVCMGGDDGLFQGRIAGAASDHSYHFRLRQTARYRLALAVPQLRRPADATVPFQKRSCKEINRMDHKVACHPVRDGSLDRCLIYKSM